MKKTFTLIAFIAGAFVFTQCSTKKAATTPPPPPAPPTAAVEKHTEAELAEGKLIWQEKCVKCHKLYLPDSYTPERWRPILISMNKKAKLDERQSELVTAYVLAHAKS